MRTIWKYEFPVSGALKLSQSVASHLTFELTMPRYANVLCLKKQHGLPCLWCEVDTNQPEVPYRIHRIGTGVELPAVERGVYLRYIDTYLTETDHYVWHVWIEEPDEMRSVNV